MITFWGGLSGIGLFGLSSSSSLMASNHHDYYGHAWGLKRVRTLGLLSYAIHPFDPVL